MIACDELNLFLVHFHKNGTKLCWFRVYDHPKDSPDHVQFKDPIASLDTEKHTELKKERDKLHVRDGFSRQVILAPT